MSKQITQPSEVRDELAINRARLDDELVGQPSLVFDVQMEYAKVMSKKDAIKEALKRLEVEKFKHFKRTLEKGTDKDANAEVELDEEVQKLRDNYALAMGMARRWEAAFESVKARGYALHKLVDMHLTQGAAIAGQFERGDDRSQEAMRERRRRRSEESQSAETDTGNEEASAGTPRRKRRTRRTSSDE